MIIYVITEILKSKPGILISNGPIPKELQKTYNKATNVLNTEKRFSVMALPEEDFPKRDQIFAFLLKRLLSKLPSDAYAGLEALKGKPNSISWQILKNLEEVNRKTLQHVLELLNTLVESNWDPHAVAKAMFPSMFQYAEWSDEYGPYCTALLEPYDYLAYWRKETVVGQYGWAEYRHEGAPLGSVAECDKNGVPMVVVKITEFLEGRTDVVELFLVGYRKSRTTRLSKF